MSSRTPLSKASPAPRQGAERDRRSSFASDEERIARWTAWYEGLPGDLQDSVDESIQSPGRGSTP
jgi:hypothetical protein